MRYGGAEDASDIRGSVQRDLPRASVELLQDIRARAQRQREWRADLTRREAHRLLDEEGPGRRRCRRLADDCAEALHEAALLEHEHAPAQGVDGDVPRRACERGCLGADPAGAAVGSAGQPYV